MAARLSSYFVRLVALSSICVTPVQPQTGSDHVYLLAVDFLIAQNQPVAKAKAKAKTAAKKKAKSKK